MQPVFPNHNEAIQNQLKMRFGNVKNDAKTPSEPTTKISDLSTQNTTPIVANRVLEIENKDHTEEAEKLYQKAKTSLEKVEVQEAFDLISQALSDSPKYKEAIGFKTCLSAVLKMIEEAPRIDTLKKHQLDEFRNDVQKTLGLNLGLGRKYNESTHLMEKIITKLENKIAFSDEESEVMEKHFKDKEQKNLRVFYRDEQQVQFLQDFLKAS